MRSCDQTWSGKVGTIEKWIAGIIFIFGGNLKNDTNDMNGKNDRIGTDGGNVNNEYSVLEPSVTLQDSRTFVVFVCNISRTDIGECRALDGE